LGAAIGCAHFFDVKLERGIESALKLGRDHWLRAF
jgi:hypothetical protein